MAWRKGNAHGDGSVVDVYWVVYCKQQGSLLCRSEREEITWNWINEHGAEFLNYILHHVKWTVITEDGQMGGTCSRNEDVEKLITIFIWNSEGNTVKYTYNGTATDRIFCFCMQLPFNTGYYYYYYYWYSALGPVWAETRAQSGDWYGSGTLHPGQVLRGSLPLLSPAF